MTVSISVLDHGSGNLHSVSRAIAKVGGSPNVTCEADQLLAGDALVIPGVGHFGTCVRAIADRGLVEPVREFARSGRPMFGVCVGMQVMFDASQEDPAEGLGLIRGSCLRLPATVKVPHMGWNQVEWTRDHPYTAGIPTGTRFYFVHSFAPDTSDDVAVGVTEYGRRFTSAVSVDNVFATQFHPEKSGDAGLHIYENFVRAVAA